MAVCNSPGRGFGELSGGFVTSQRADFYNHVYRRQMYPEVEQAEEAKSGFPSLKIGTEFCTVWNSLVALVLVPPALSSWDNEDEGHRAANAAP